MTVCWVTVQNVTRSTTLAWRACVAASMLHRGRGLIGWRGIPVGGGMVLPRVGSIHTVGVRFPIDVLFLDRGGQVLRMVRQLRPCRVALGPRGSHTTIELAAGTLSLETCSTGDLIVLQPAPDKVPAVQQTNAIAGNPPESDTP